MALEIPWDVPTNSFTRAGMMTIDGDMFERDKKVGTLALSREIEYVKANVAEGSLQTQSEWQQVRNVFLLWCFSSRTQSDDTALNAFLKFVGLKGVSVPGDATSTVFAIIETKYNQSLRQFTSPAAWIQQKPPPQRLPTPSSLPPLSQDYQYPTFPSAIIDTQPDQPGPPPPLIHTPRSSLGFNANPKFQGKYNFTDHRQEYEGYQFQCIFRCLKDGKHCRKAPVREMNRHLRSRHNFRPGFKIAGVDWELKRWRGAGADHEECVGKIVEKDAADDSENNESDLEYTMDAA